MFEFIKNLNSVATKNILLLTPNTRLAQYLKQQFDFYNKSSGLQTWQIPSICAFSHWQESFWYEYQNDDRILLNEFQEFLLWQKCINAKTPFSNTTINNIKNAFDILQQWQITTAELYKYHHHEAKIFANFAKNFLLQSKNYLIKSTLTRTIVDTLQQNPQTHTTIPNHIILVGFDEFSFTPIVKSFLSFLESKGHKIEKINFSTKTRSINRIGFKNQNEEILSLALWAKERHLENPKNNIGCVIPNLTTIREQVSRIFTQICAPNIAFNISAGKIFAEYPIIISALKILNLGNMQNDLENLIYLLHSPYILDGIKQKAPYTLLAAKLQNLKSNQFKFSCFLTHLEQLEELSSAIKNIFQLHQKLLNNKTKLQSHAKWADFFKLQLQNFCWPQISLLNSEEFQTVKRLEKMLNEFSALDLIENAISHAKALEELEYLAQNIIFQPKNAQCAINILGTLEASGMIFDHLWIMGMNNKSWPSAANPNPFIPIELQKKHQMPHASAERELQFCKVLTERFSQSASEVIFSFATEIEGEQYKPSPLINAFSEKSFADFNFTYENFAKKIFATQKLTTIFNDDFIPIKPEENLIASGELFKSHSLCPFRAFAKFRLKAKSLEESYENTLRGKFVHKILEQIWQQIKSHDNLIKISAAKLNSIINTIIDEHFTNLQTSAKTNNAIIENFIISDNFIKLEKICLQNLITKWLEFEKTRAPFKTIALEKSIETIIGNLKLKLRLDRMDLLDDNTAIILDYKTGKKMPEFNDWSTTRPEDPQLPLYFVAVANVMSEKIAGILLANLNIHELNTTKKKFLHGKVKDPTKIHDSLDAEINWEEVTQTWKKIIENLAQDFCNGNTKVDPINKQSACKYCDLPALCRINYG